MALIKFGMMMTDARGKLGGQVFTKTRSGATVRTKVTPVNNKTIAQGAVRNRLAGFSRGWSELTEAQRASWIGAVDSFKRTNVFGDLYAPSGRSLYISINSNIANVGGVALSTAPASTEVTGLVEFNSEMQANQLLINGATTRETLAGDMLVIEATAQNNAGRYNFSGQYRQVIVIPLVVGDDTFEGDIMTAYVAKFGDITTKKKVSIRGYVINSNQGVASPRLTNDIIF